MTDTAHLRRWAKPIVPAGVGAPLVKKTHDLNFQLVWLDGSHSCDWDFNEKHLPKFLLEAMRKLIEWKKMQGYEFYHIQGSGPPDKSWRRFPNLGFWWKGPVEALVLGGYILRGDKERDFDGTVGPWPIAPQKRSGLEHLEEAGGKISYCVGGYFIVKETLTEVPVKEAL